jgi:hypothetical protein
VAKESTPRSWSRARARSWAYHVPEYEITFNGVVVYPEHAQNTRRGLVGVRIDTRRRRAPTT